MKSKKQKQQGVAGTVFFVIVLAVLIVTTYYLIITKQKEKGAIEVEVAQSEYQILSAKDLKNNYPATVRETVKLYCRITKCLYNEGLSDGETEVLVKKLRELFDEDLLEANPEYSHISNIKGDIAHYRSNNMNINSYSVDKASKVKTKNTSLGELAVLNMYFTVKEGTHFNRSYEEMYLRKDSEGHWKVAGWRSIDSANVEDDD